MTHAHTPHIRHVYASIFWSEISPDMNHDFDVFYILTLRTRNINMYMYRSTIVHVRVCVHVKVSGTWEAFFQMMNAECLAIV